MKNETFETLQIDERHIVRKIRVYITEQTNYGNLINKNDYKNNELKKYYEEYKKIALLYFEKNAIEIDELKKEKLIAISISGIYPTNYYVKDWRYNLENRADCLAFKSPIERLEWIIEFGIEKEYQEILLDTLFEINNIELAQVKKIYDERYNFNDFFKLSDRTIQELLLKEIQLDYLIIALQYALPEQIEIIYRNLSKNNKKVLMDKLQLQQDSNISHYQIILAQKRIMAIVNKIFNYYPEANLDL